MPGYRRSRRSPARKRQRSGLSLAKARTTVDKRQNKAIQKLAKSLTLTRFADYGTNDPTIFFDVNNYATAATLTSIFPAIDASTPASKFVTLSGDRGKYVRIHGKVQINNATGLTSFPMVRVLVIESKAALTNSNIEFLTALAPGGTNKQLLSVGDRDPNFRVAYDNVFLLGPVVNTAFPSLNGNIPSSKLIKIDVPLKFDFQVGLAVAGVAPIVSGFLYAYIFSDVADAVVNGRVYFRITYTA